jgi:uncharacterized membrane protein
MTIDDVVIPGGNNYNMTVILFSVIILAYIFSGLICCLAFLSQFNQQSSLLAVLAGFLIVVFWPIWIIIEITEAFKKVKNIEDKESL